MCRFLLVTLNIEVILAEVTIRQRRKKLEEVGGGNGLSDAYTTTLMRLKGQKGNKSALGLKVLMWVLYSKRPLRAEELCHALGVEIGSADLDPSNVPPLRTLLASCLGLVTIELSSSRVRLVHFILQEHLLSNPTLFQSPHSTIAEVCLTYLNFRRIGDFPPTLDSATSTMPLLEYASRYWGGHTREGVTEDIKILALRLLDRFDEHISAQQLLLHHNEGYNPGPYFLVDQGPTGFTGLHGASFLGIAEIVAGVLEMKEWDVNARDCMGNTALTWASIKGYEEVIKLLLERKDVNPDQASPEDGRTPLLWAAMHGREGVVKMLLERENVNPDQVDTGYGQTPLLWASGNGHEGVVKMLLEREDVNAGLVDTGYGRTPLSWAAENGYEGVVKMLLEREDVNPDRIDTIYGQTPLSWAAENGHSGVVKILLERKDVNPDQADTKYGRTPLSWAAKNGYEGVVKMLLERDDVNPDQVDTEYGQTPLWWAAGNGHEVVVKMLLEREDVNPDRIDTIYGQTPLSRAAKNGYEGVVKMLLERGDVNPGQVDIGYGRTPLTWALVKGHGGVLKLLLEQQGSRTATLDKKSQTPPSLVLSEAHDQVVQILRDNSNYTTSAGHGGQRTADPQSRNHDPDTIINLNHQLAPPPAYPGDRNGTPEPKDPFSKSVESDLSEAESTALPRPHSMSPLKPLSPPPRTDTHSNSARSTLSFALSWYFFTASFICLLAFLVYSPPSSLPYIFSSHR